ncbi:MAG: right-handed parallel beta-helix repeat-containing protein [Verrucomicrobiota bacterium]
MNRAILLSLSFVGTLTAAEIYVAPAGDDAAQGTAAHPVRTIDRALELAVRDGAGEPADIRLMDGVYWRERPLVLDEKFSGRPGRSARLSAVNPGRAVIKGGFEIPASRFVPVSDSVHATLLQAPARGEVRVADLSAHPVGKGVFGAPGLLRLRSGNRALSEARWPDAGFAHSDRVVDEGTVWLGGRSTGPKPVFDLANPIGAEFTVREKWKGDWARELAAGISQPRVFGYFANDWFYQNDRLARVSGGALKLLSNGRYKFAAEKRIPRRVFVVGLLSELNRPGEWFWDAQERKLYVWPLSTNAAVEIPGPLTLLQVTNASHVTIEGIVFESANQGVTIEGGSDVRLAGCVVRNLSGRGVFVSGGRDHEVRSCDIHAVNVPIEIRGTVPAAYRWERVEGRLRPVPDGHRIVNNHIYDCRHERGIQLHGVGIQVAHNLVHDLRGSALSWTGNDHRIEFNEFHSVLTEMGDWGVTYTGASWTSHGNVLRHNFVHHVFGVPATHPVNGFYFDDLDQGDRVEGNVFYKVGYRAVMLNGGAAQTVTNNLFVENYINVFQTASKAESYRGERKDYDSGRLKRGDKTDYLWRTEQITGPEGWKRGPWAEAYPEFARAMASDPYSPVMTSVTRNRTHGVIDREVLLRSVPDGMVVPEPMTAVPRTAFVDPDALDFRFKPGFEPNDGFAAIPFERIGLVPDAFRPDPPDRATYRRAVCRLHKDRPAYDPAAKYQSSLP